MEDKTLEQLWIENNRKFPFKAKSLNKDWWERSYKNSEFITLTGICENSDYFICPEQNQYLICPNDGKSYINRMYKYFNRGGGWVLIPEKEIIGTLKDFRKQGILPPYTAKRRGRINEVLSYDESTKRYDVLIFREDNRITRHLLNGILKYTLLKGE